MQIKTLAQILDENSVSIKKASDARKVTNPKHSQGKKKPRVDKNSTRGYAIAEKTVQTTSNKYENINENTNENNNNNNRRYDSSSRLSNSDKTNDANLLTEPLSSKKRLNPRSKYKKKKKQFHPASPYQPKRINPTPVIEVDPNSIKSLLEQVRAENTTTSSSKPVSSIDSTEKSGDIPSDAYNDSNALADIDNLPEALKAYLKTPEQRQADKEEIKANSRLRWLAFYYLSRREHSAGELRQKLIDKEQDPIKIEALLEEFAEKGYQSDYRTALMLIREGIRKGRGRVRIKNDFYKRKVNMPVNLDELIDMAMEDNEEFIDVLSNNDLINGVDWLRLAVEAREKKYGPAIPSEQKEKARQLRFLQYRGFKPDICFEAIHYNLDTLDDRF